MGTKVCSCGNAIPNLTLIAGKVRNLSNRKFCLTCSPFGKHNTRDLTQPRRSAAQHTERFWRYQSRERKDRKTRLVELRGGRCSLCGYCKCIGALEFHHRDPSTKVFELSKSNLLRRWDVVLVEVEKCELLCANCHREVEERQAQELQESLEAGNFLAMVNC
jgi:hypothetical protein